MLNKTTPTMKWLHHGRLEQESASITRRRANRRCSGWPCRRGGRRLRVGCLGDVEGPDGGGSGCWQVGRTAVCGRTEIATRLEHPLGGGVKGSGVPRVQAGRVL